MKRLFITDYIGLCNRIEGLSLSFGIADRCGHEVCVDWPESDSLHIEGTSRRKFHWWDRIGSIKLRDDAPLTFEDLRKYRRIVQRTDRAFAKPELLAGYAQGLGARMRIRADLRDAIASAFRKFDGRPVVGLHIRRGDFRIASEDVYDTKAIKHPAVPLWRYLYAMERLKRVAPNVCFLLCATGDPDELKLLREHFDVFSIPIPSPYNARGEDHRSSTHPVADLFGLASCSIILGTPLSSFTHTAAHVLGKPSQVLVPPNRVCRDAPAIALANLAGKSFREWTQAGRSGVGIDILPPDARLPMPTIPRASRMETF